MKYINLIKNLFAKKQQVAATSHDTKWQPIETAPKTPTRSHDKGEVFDPILLCIEGSDSALIGGYITSKDAFWTPQKKFATYTHWMPLPKPPAK